MPPSGLLATMLLACAHGDLTTDDPRDTAETGPTARDSGGADSATDTADTADTATGARTPAACTSWGTPAQTGALVDPELDEVSGVAPSAVTPGALWVHEDHGGPTVITAVDELGNTLGALTLEGVTNVDWEAMALAPCQEGSCLWVADIGDNANARTDAALLRVPEPPVTQGLDLHVVPERFPVAYPDQPQNAESFTFLPDGRGIVVTKRFDHTAGVYALDAGASVFTHVAEIVSGETPDDDVADAVTDADVWPDGTRLLVRTYGSATEFDLGAAGGIENVADAPRVTLPFASRPHVEAIAYDPDRRGYWQVPEGVGAPIDFVPCLD